MFSGVIDQIEISVRTHERLKQFYVKHGYKKGETDECHFLHTALTTDLFRKFMGAKAYREITEALAKTLLVAIQQYPSGPIEPDEPPHMRDAFAAVALNGLLANGHDDALSVAIRAYQLADAMIKARAPKPQPTPEQVKSLRELTGAGLMECKKALIETDCDIEAAERYLNRR